LPGATELKTEEIGANNCLESVAREVQRKRVTVWKVFGIICVGLPIGGCSALYRTEDASLGWPLIDFREEYNSLRIGEDGLKELEEKFGASTEIEVLADGSRRVIFSPDIQVADWDNHSKKIASSVWYRVVFRMENSVVIGTSLETHYVANFCPACGEDR
jgi:hypothetical protein